MEKLSVNDVLALLLPGLFFLFCIHIITELTPLCLSLSVNNPLGYFEKNEFLNTTFFLLFAIVAGAVVQRIIAIIINNKWYNPHAGIYKRTGLIFKEIRMLQHWLPFYNSDCKRVFGFRYDGSDMEAENETIKMQNTIDVQGDYFDYVFYAMMNSEKNDEARTQQNFYFLFRSLFTVSVIAATGAFIVSIFSVVQTGLRQSAVIISLTVLLLLFAFIICRPLGIWYRKRMIRVLFYQYYLEKNS